MKHRRKLALAAALSAVLLIASTTDAWAAGTGKIRAIAAQLLEDLGITTGGVYAPGTGGFTLFVPASAMVAAPGDTVIPGLTTLATSGMPALAFDGATNEDILGRAVMSAAYDSGSDLTIEIVWTAAGTSQSVEWDAEIAALNGQDIDGAAPAFDAAIAHDATSNATQGIITTTSTTNANALVDAIAAGEAFTVRITRDAAADSSTVDANLIGVRFSQ